MTFRSHLKNAKVRIKLGMAKDIIDYARENSLDAILV